MLQGKKMKYLILIIPVLLLLLPLQAGAAGIIKSVLMFQTAA